MMLLFPIVFYAWGEPVYVLLLVGMALADWFFAQFIGNNLKTGKAKLGLVLTCVITSESSPFLNTPVSCSETHRRYLGFRILFRKSLCQSVFRFIPSSGCLMLWMCTAGRSSLSGNFTPCFYMSASFTSALPVLSCVTVMWNGSLSAGGQTGGICPRVSHVLPWGSQKRRCLPTLAVFWPIPS